MNENMAFPAAESISKSMFGNGSSSLGQALLRFLKSTQHLICPFFFLTGTMLDSQRGCWIGLMNPAASNFCTSLTICPSISVWNILAGWATGLASRSTFSVCATSLGSKIDLFPSPYHQTTPPLPFTSDPWPHHVLYWLGTGWWRLGLARASLSNLSKRLPAAHVSVVTWRLSVCVS